MEASRYVKAHQRRLCERARDVVDDGVRQSLLHCVVYCQLLIEMLAYTNNVLCVAD